MNKSSEEIKNTVLEKIRRGDVQMRPRIYFVAQITLVATTAVLAFVASALVISFAFFSLEESGELFLLGFGLRGLVTFLFIFPWIELVIAIALIFLLEWLLRHFKWNYRLPILKTFFATLLVIFVFGLLISITPLHNNLLTIADRGDLPVVGELYENINTLHEDRGEYRGAIVSISGSEIIITHNDYDYDTDDGTWKIDVPANFDVNTLQIGDRVYVLGNPADGVVLAIGLKKF
jgi:hypothetical protein